MNIKRLTFTATGLLVLFGLFLWMKPAPEPAAKAPLAAEEMIEGSAPAAAVQSDIPELNGSDGTVPAPQPQRFEWTVSNGRRASGPERVIVHVGDTVSLTLHSDQPEELHLHGYDLHQHVHANQAATLEFIAKHAGRFALELHHSDVELTVVEVRP